MNESRPQVKLIGEDGNAFAILGACLRAAKSAGWSEEKREQVRAEMTAADYNNLLNVAGKYFEVV